MGEQSPALAVLEERRHLTVQEYCPSALEKLFRVFRGLFESDRRWEWRKFTVDVGMGGWRVR